MVKENLITPRLNEEKGHSEQQNDDADDAPFGRFGEIAPKGFGVLQSLRIYVCRLMLIRTHVNLLSDIQSDFAAYDNHLGQ